MSALPPPPTSPSTHTHTPLHDQYDQYGSTCPEAGIGRGALGLRGRRRGEHPWLAGWQASLARLLRLLPLSLPRAGRA